MIKRLLSAMSALFLMSALAVAAPLEGQETYDLLFRNGTLDDVSRDEALVYERDVQNVLKPDAAERDTGQVALSIGPGDSALAQLEFRQDSKTRKLGQFPASVGNPMIMYFYETVVRDMAETAGGSSFYIRNRVKEALVEPSEVEIGETQLNGETLSTQIVRLKPFEGDPNSERMQGFGDLVLTIVMSEDVPGWYVSLLAEAPGQDGNAIYRSELTFDRLEALK